MTVAQLDRQTNTSPASVLIIDDDPIVLNSTTEFLSLEGHQVQAATNFDRARRILEEGEIQIVLTDLNMPDHDGLEVIRFISQHYPEVVCIVITAYGSISSAVEAVKLGAYDYLTKPTVDDELLFTIERALKQQTLQAENIVLKQQLRRQERFGDMIAQDPQMQKIFDLIDTVAPTSTTVLITGESGTGKSMVVRAIHRRSIRKDNPFVEVSCGALPESLLESELFGHVRGSFTGALADKEGRFLAAEGGTIFLDEIDSASAGMQVKLLRVLQERQFEPVGSNKTISVDVRVVVATNKDLKDLVKCEQFRQDLYYRINVVQIDMPPLRDRLADIRLLANHFLEKFRNRHEKQIETLSPEALHVLERHSWPGNVRELENVIERAVVLAPRQIILPEDLPADLLTAGLVADVPMAGQGPTTLSDALLQSERQIIAHALDRCNWSRKQTAKMLGISRTSLFRKMRQSHLLDGEAD